MWAFFSTIGSPEFVPHLKSLGKKNTSPKNRQINVPKLASVAHPPKHLKVLLFQWW